MADQNHLAGYKYGAMSNLVLQADKRFISRRSDEATGDPESLAGRISVRDMGAQIARGDASEAKRKTKPVMERGGIREGEDVLEREQKKRKRDTQAPTGFSLADLEIEDLRYKPRTAGTRATYDLIITTVGRNLGDVPAQITVSAADAVLETLKNEEMKDFDKKKEIDDVLGSSMSSKEFNELVNLSKKITDYDSQDADDDKPEAAAGADGEDLDERQGVAVMFDDEDDDKDEDGIARTNEVRDEDETSDEDENEVVTQRGRDEQMTANGAEGDENQDSQADEEEMILDSKPSGSERRSNKDYQVIPAYEIDAFWLQRQIGNVFTDAHIQQEKTREAFDILSSKDDDGNAAPLRDVENDLMELFDYEHHELVTKLVINRDRIIWIIRWRRASDDDTLQKSIERQMADGNQHALLKELKTRASAPNGQDSSQLKSKSEPMDIDESQSALKDVPMANGDIDRPRQSLQPRRVIDLSNLVFDQGNHLMTNPNVKLPPGSVQKKFKGYEEVHVPAPKSQKGPGERKNMSTSELPKWAQAGFGSSKELNRIQTQCYQTAFNDDGNMLVCAPTGSGKTNVAMLTMLREIGKHRNPQTGEINLDDFKIIYIAPLKALVQEQVGNFGARLKPYGIKVSELTGDRQLTKQQVSETQIIVTTPEKWDVITRKATDLTYTNLVRLICIDEIHLLHDERGPVLESIVSRTIRRIEQTGEHMRLVGLSATLPNYRDVASFLRVDPLKGMFHFDGSFRPCPLRQEFVGVTEKKPIKQLKTMNEVCYQKVLDQVGKQRNQMLIFVHSRKDTAKTAKYIRDKALEDETMGQILRSDAAGREILTSEAESVVNQDLKDLMQYGFGIHHAGMNRNDRNSVEELFADGYLQVLVCTATLAWGVNLPAHTVIIKGTQVYSPEKGTWVELSPQDVLQMLGRAGRPQYDTFGEGIIITTHAELQYYLSLMNQQLPIESQFVSKLVDNLNAEIVLGNVRNRDEGIDWLSYTYLFVRMLKSPGLYSVGADYENDEALEQKRCDLIHSAAVVLEKCGLVKYEKKTGKLQSTELGRIASHYYITNNSMMTYQQHIQRSVTLVDMFRIFALSEEFKYIPVRQDEKLELAKLLARVPISVKESIEEPHAKINVLLQAYISRLKLEGLALMADLVYVTQSAGRILRALYEICLARRWASIAKTTLDLCKMVEKRIWPMMTPLRQFPERAEPGVPTCPRDVIQKAERVDVPWRSYFDLDPPRMGELLGMPKSGRIVCNAVEHFPRLDVQAQIQPMTRTLLRIELTITPNFKWNDVLHGASELFWIMVKDYDDGDILFFDQFLLRKAYAQSEMNEHLVELTVPIMEPMPPNYFVSVISDRWMYSETEIPVSFRKLLLPELFQPPTKLLDLQPLPIAALKRKDYQSLYAGWQSFNKIQTQVFNSLFTTDDNVLVGAPVASGKTTCAEFALLRQWTKQESNSRAVYVAPMQEQVDSKFNYWRSRLANVGGGKTIVKLTGEITVDQKILEKGDLILATPTQWDSISRQWQRRKAVQSVKLFIADDLHMLGGQYGYIYEVVVSRMHTISLQLNSGLRIVGLSVSLSNAQDVGEWVGANKHNIFNFSPQNRPLPLELHIQAFSIPHFPSLMLAMAKPTYQAILQHAPSKPAIVFVSGRKQVRKTAVDILGYSVADSDDNEERFLHANVDEMSNVLNRMNERALAESISHGIGYFHEALSSFDKQAVQYLFNQGAIQVMIVSRDCCWEIESNAHLVVIMGTQFFDGREHRYIDYPVSEILQMFGKAGRNGQDKTSKGVLMVPGVKRDYYRKFLAEALPIESQLQSYLHDAFVSEISSKVIAGTQDAVDWTTYTFFYRRLLANPSYYGLTDTSHEGLSAFLSELIESTMKELSEANMIEVDEEDDTVAPLNPAMIAAYYNISFITMQTFLLSLNGKTKMKALLEIVTSATEFEAIQIRRHEDHILRRIYDRLPLKMAEPSFETAHFKAFVLLQAHFSRMQLPIDLLKDQEIILSKVLTLLSASVDILSSEGHLNAMTAMEMSQMVVQAMWDRDTPLKQIPHFGPEQLQVAEKAGINDIFEFMEAMDPSENKDYDKLTKSLGLTNKQLADAANFTNNKYPSVEISYEVEDKDEVTAGSPSRLLVNVEREADEDTENEPDLRVHKPLYPADKSESWWLVLGEVSTKSLLAIRRITIGREASAKLEFTMPSAGKHDLTLYLMCDSYVGVDQAPEFELDVAEGEDEEDEEEVEADE